MAVTLSSVMRVPGAGVAALIALALLSACVPPPTPPVRPAVGGAGVPDAPEPEYRLGPGDEIEISFLRTPEFNSRQIVRSDGAISLAGLKPPAPVEVIAADVSLRELRRLLVDAYSRELRDPEITITIKAYGAAVVYVMGEVGRPGPVPYAGSMSALQAIAAAEGVKSSARLHQVLVIRRERGGQASWRVLDLRRAVGRGDFRDDAPLVPRDIVYVPRSAIGNIDEFVDLYIRKVLPIQPGFTLPVR